MTSGLVMFARAGPYQYQVLYIRADNALHCVCLYVQSYQRFGVSLYLRGFPAGLINCYGKLDRCYCPLCFPLYIRIQLIRVLGFLFVRGLYLE
jgi:hypothetical protein